MNCTEGLSCNAWCNSRAQAGVKVEFGAELEFESKKRHKSLYGSVSVIFWLKSLLCMWPGWNANMAFGSIQPRVQARAALIGTVAHAWRCKSFENTLSLWCIVAYVCISCAATVSSSICVKCSCFRVLSVRCVSYDFQFQLDRHLPEPQERPQLGVELVVLVELQLCAIATFNGSIFGSVGKPSKYSFALVTGTLDSSIVGMWLCCTCETFVSKLSLQRRIGLRFYIHCQSVVY